MEETILDPDRRRVSEGVLGGMDTTWVMILPENSALRIFPRWYRVLVTKILPLNKSCPKKHPQPQDQRCSLMLLPWNLLDPGYCILRERTEAPLPPPRPRRKFIHPKELSPFRERLELPFPSEEILSGYEDVVSSGTDQFTTWVKTDPDVTLVRHVVVVQKAVAVSEDRTLLNSRIVPTKRLDDNSDVPKARLGILPRICTSSKRTTGLHYCHEHIKGFSQEPHQESRVRESLW